MESSDARVKYDVEQVAQPRALGEEAPFTEFKKPIFSPKSTTFSNNLDNLELLLHRYEEALKALGEKNIDLETKLARFKELNK
jgi:hypothetical protein